jgi:hypothetical protein
MYDAFDSFIRVGTWQTRQPSDQERFHLALGKVVWSNDFDPDQMADYLREKLNLPPDLRIADLISHKRLTDIAMMLGR